MATTPTANDLTRQQLDDLDALLQRMLAVPIASREPAATKVEVPSVTTRVDPPTPAARTPHLAPSMILEAEVVSQPAPTIYETRIDSRSFQWPETQPMGPTASAAPERLFGQTDMPMTVEQRAASVSLERDPEPNITVEPPAVTFQKAVEMPELTSQDSTIPLQIAPLPEPPLFAPAGQVPILALPIYGVNRVLEGCLNLFGPPGELFTTGPMKWLLGLTGLGLLGFSGAWAARGMGWVNW